MVVVIKSEGAEVVAGLVVMIIGYNSNRNSRSSSTSSTPSSISSSSSSSSTHRRSGVSSLSPV